MEETGDLNPIEPTHQEAIPTGSNEEALTLAEAREKEKGMYSKLMDGMQESAESLGGYFFGKAPRQYRENQPKVEDERVFVLRAEEPMLLDGRGKAIVYITEGGVFSLGEDESRVSRFLDNIDVSTGDFSDANMARFSDGKLHVGFLSGEVNPRRLNLDSEHNYGQFHLQEAIRRSIELTKVRLEDRKRVDEEARIQEEQKRIREEEEQMKKREEEQQEVRRISEKVQKVDSLIDFMRNTSQEDPPTQESL